MKPPTQVHILEEVAPFPKAQSTKVMSICSPSSGLSQSHSLPSGNSFATIISKLNELLFGAGEVDLGESVGGGVKS